MLKNILNFEGAQQLANNELKKVNGGTPPVPPGLCYCENLGYEVDCDYYDHICPLNY
ncbi:hypothetical protein [Flavobacterium sp. H122]|uniref:hypothetical protein n=1 Tax=Flavobacterium sp. H122 TaxID=2529860 RepID=UPI00145A2C8B|nr:hypothetical protein [Flavobacterium sp. H122]